LSAARTDATFSPPVMAARRWIEGVAFPDDRPLINVSQAAPVAPPPPELRREMARLVVEDPGSHLYGPVLGLPALREEVARRAADGDATDEAITRGAAAAMAERRGADLGPVARQDLDNAKRVLAEVR